jgi:carboxyl-terminal processing protease
MKTGRQFQFLKNLYASHFLSVLVSFLILFSGWPVFSDDIELPSEADYSSLGWVDAFEKMHEKYSAEYALGVWKDVPWENLKKKYIRMISKAERKLSYEEFAIAVKNYALSVPDGHISVKGDIYPGVSSMAIGGGFGLSLADLDDGTVVAAYVQAGSSAEKAGILKGAEIVKWNGKNILKAIKSQNISFRFGNSGNATTEKETILKTLYLTRSHVGAISTVTFINPGGKKPVRKRLQAVWDDLEAFNKGNFCEPAPLAPPTLEYKMLESGYGYMKLRAIIYLEEALKGTDDPEKLIEPLYNEFKEAVTYFSDNNVPGIIIDLRGNHGGYDQLAARMSGFFQPVKQFYERQKYYNVKTGQFEVYTLDDYNLPVDAIYIEPQTPQYSGKVIAIVSPDTISSGEGLAMGIQNAPNGRIIGFYGSDGSFGMVGDSIKMPCGIKISFPYGQSIDENGIVQIDSRGGVGGIVPDIRVPMNIFNAVAFGDGTDVLLNEAVKALSIGQ